MHQAPEGLKYGDQNKQGDRNMPDSLLEKGKYDTARAAHYGKECDDAEALRMLTGGSSDPVYASNRKNK